MNKAQRLVQLIMLVNERQTFTIQELADECGVSRRTMIRDLMELSELGVPLYSQPGPGGGYRVLRDKVLPPIQFTEHEATALFLAGQSLKNYRHLPFENEVNSALHKFYHYLPNELKRKIDHMQQKLVFWIPPHQLELPHLRGLLDAALEQRPVQITYEAAQRKERTIHPIGLYTMNGLWYCQAYCELAQGDRVFRVDRVQELDVLPQQHVDHSKLTKVENIRPWIMRMDETDTLELKVALTPEGVRRCQSELWLSSSIDTHEDGSGVIRRSISSSYMSWAVHFFLGLGAEANVYEPAELRSLIQQKLQQLIELYRK
ncbi:helix-turn-helix transcriptional regulator [Paenibacillus vandeheii]